MENNNVVGRLLLKDNVAFIKKRSTSHILDGKLVYAGKVQQFSGMSISGVYSALFPNNVNEKLIIKEFSKHNQILGRLYWAYETSTMVAQFDCIFIVEGVSLYTWTALIDENLFEGIEEILNILSINLSHEAVLKGDTRNSFVFDGGCLDVPHDVFSEKSEVVYYNDLGVCLEILYATGYSFESDDISLQELEEDGACILKYGKRQTTVFDGFEMCFFSNSDEHVGKIDLFFSFESSEIESPVWRPYISICLSSLDGYSCTRSDVEKLIAFWDNFIDSIKINY